MKLWPVPLSANCSAALSSASGRTRVAFVLLVKHSSPERNAQLDGKCHRSHWSDGGILLDGSGYLAIVSLSAACIWEDGVVIDIQYISVALFNTLPHLTKILGTVKSLPVT